jgi:hypothetical protein
MGRRRGQAAGTFPWIASVPDWQPRLLCPTMRILIVEDDQKLSAFVRGGLEREGHLSMSE